MDYLAQEIRRILVIAWGILGDSVCKLPAIAALRARFPEAQMVVWADAGMKEVFEGHPFIDTLWLISGRGRGLRKSLNTLGWIAPLWRQKFDLVVDLYASRHTARLVRLSCARYRTGRNRPHSARAYNILPPPEHEIFATRPLPEIFSTVARHLGADVRRSYLPLSLSSEDYHRAQEGLQSVGWQPGCPLVLINPATSNRAKTWPSERFGTVGRDLSEAGATVVVLQNPGLETLQAEVVAASRGRVRAISPLSIKAVCAALEMADLLVTGDTGIMHLGMAHHTPAVIIAGPTHPITFHAVPELQTVCFHPDSCHERDPALDCRLQRTCSHIRCIRSVGVEEVLQACLKRLQLPVAETGQRGSAPG